MPYMSKRNTTGGVVPVGSNLFGTCSTAASTATKVVTLSDFNVLVEGVTIHVYFSNGNSASAPLLQVGSTTAKNVRCNGANGGVWKGGSFVSFTYYNGYWVQNDVQDGKTYGLSLSGNTLSIVENGGSSSVTILAQDTTYTLSISGQVLTLSGSDGSTSTATVPDTDTTYSISISGDVITLTGSDGTTSTVTIPVTPPLKYTEDAPDGARTNNVVQNDVTGNTATGGYALAEGYQTTASGWRSHAEGRETVASGDRSHAEGFQTTASGHESHAEGSNTESTGDRSHAEGYETEASGANAHAEGWDTEASGNHSHAEGLKTIASGKSAHAEGSNISYDGGQTYYTLEASGEGSHAEGGGTVASAKWGHAQGSCTVAQGYSQFVFGKWNLAQGTPDQWQSGDYMLIGGNGVEGNRSNAMTMTWDGDVVFAGSLRAKTEILTPTITVSTGTLIDSSCKRFGNIIELTLEVQNTSSVASGQNIFVASVSGIPLPSISLRGSTFFGARILGMGFSNTGTINLNNTYSAAVTLSSSTVLHFTYIV